MITAFYGNPVSVFQLRDMANVDVNGASLWSIARAAERLGFHARGLQLELAALRHIHLPAIVHWQGFHYVVLYEVKRHHVVLADPGIGLRRIRRQEFETSWTGRALELVPGHQLTRIAASAGCWKRFWPVVMSNKWILGEVFAASALLSLLGLGIPMFTQLIVDRVLVNRSIDLLNMLLIGMILVTLFQSLIRGVRWQLLVHVSTRFDARLIADFFRHLLTLPMHFFDLRRVGDIVSRVAENKKVRSALANTLPAVLLDTVLAGSYLALLASYDHQLTLIVVSTLPAFIGVTCFFTPRIQRNQKEQFARYVEANTLLIETINGMRTVKSMAIESQTRSQMESLYVAYLLTTRNGANWTTVYAGLGMFLQTTSCVVFLWYGAHRVLENTMSVGQLLAFVTIASNVIGPVLNVVQSWETLQEARNAMERLNDIFQAEPEQQAAEPLLHLQRIDGRIRFDQVTFSYGGDGERPTLVGVNLDIHPGEFVAVVGRSGSGKSTLMKLALGLYQPTQGRVTIDEHDVRTVEHGSLRRRMGVVPQEVFLFSGTIRDNISVGYPDMPLEQIVAAAKLAGAHDFICQLSLGYATKVGEQGMALSGGQRQRIALARALVHDPDVLFLDEATAALDHASERDIQDNLAHAARGRTTFVIAHRLSTVHHADRILVMDSGQIVEEGTHEELISRHRMYCELMGEQLA
jgi:ATP-binding cassette subfamily B protein